MAHYIDKEKLIKRLEEQREYYQNINSSHASSVVEGLELALNMCDTLEGKEVDLEKVFNDEYSKFGSVPIADEDDPNQGIYAFAKYFFELGMSVNSKAQKGE